MPTARAARSCRALKRTCWLGWVPAEAAGSRLARYWRGPRSCAASRSLGRPARLRSPAGHMHSAAEPWRGCLPVTVELGSCAWAACVRVPKQDPLRRASAEACNSEQHHALSFTTSCAFDHFAVSLICCCRWKMYKQQGWWSGGIQRQGQMAGHTLLSIRKGV